MVKVLNTIHEDYHIHSLNYSDGMNTIDEIVQYAGKIGMKKIAITAHSQATIDYDKFGFRNWRTSLRRRKNVYNDVEVFFGVEWDLLDEEGNCCFAIQWHESEFCILSCHDVYKWDLKNITQAYIKALHKYHKQIKYVGHIYAKRTAAYLDVEKVVKVLNQYQIPIELNCSYLIKEKTDFDKLNHILSSIEAGVYITTDAHTLYDLNKLQEWFDYLKEKWFIQ